MGNMAEECAGETGRATRGPVKRSRCYQIERCEDTRGEGHKNKTFTGMGGKERRGASVCRRRQIFSHIRCCSKSTKRIICDVANAAT